MKKGKFRAEQDCDSHLFFSRARFARRRRDLPAVCLADLAIEKGFGLGRIGGKEKININRWLTLIFRRRDHC
jgi:hypothetical protein